MEDFQTDTSIAPVFEIAKLARMYQTCLEQLGVELRLCSHIETEAKTALCGTKSHHSKNVMFF